ncbi:glycosyltransferase [Providencia rettgeri]
MHILIICNRFYPEILGGAEISTYNFVKLLSSQKNISITIATLSNQNSLEKNKNTTIHRIKRKYPCNDESKNIHELISYYINDLFKNKYKNEIEKIITDCNPDIVHTQNIDGMGNVWKIVNKMKVPLVHTIRDDYLFPNDLYIPSNTISFKSFLKNIFNYTLGILRRSHLKNANITAISAYYAKKYTSILKKNVLEIPNFFTMNEIREFSMIKIEKKINNGVYRFGYIGRISQEKGIEFLLNTFHEISRNRDVILYVAGDYNHEYGNTMYQKYASDKVIFLGSVRAKEFFLNVDTIVIPSLWDEAFGRVAVEASLSGVDIITSNSGALVPNLIKLGVNFSYYEKNNEKNLKIHMIDRINNKDNYLQNNDADISFFSEKPVISKYMDLYYHAKK